MHLCHEELYALLMLLPGLGWAAWHIRRLVRAARPVRPPGAVRPVGTEEAGLRRSSAECPEDDTPVEMGTPAP